MVDNHRLLTQSDNRQKGQQELQPNKKETNNTM